jgi:hypothetical protein
MLSLQEKIIVKITRKYTNRDCRVFGLCPSSSIQKNTTFRKMDQVIRWEAYRILVGMPERKRPLGRPKRKWVKNRKMDLREIGWDGMDWIDLGLRIWTSGGLL